MEKIDKEAYKIYYTLHQHEPVMYNQEGFYYSKEKFNYYNKLRKQKLMKINDNNTQK